MDVFVRDRTAGTTVRASVATSNQPNNLSAAPVISGDGRYVAFQSAATNLVANDKNKKIDVFVRDLVANTTKRVSVSTSGTAANGDSTAAAISADGRYAAFASVATNLVAGDTNAVRDIFLRDTVANTTARVSVSTSGAQASQAAETPFGMSGDGRYVTWSSGATNLVSGDTNGLTDVFLRDRNASITTRVSVSSFLVESNGTSRQAAISADGSFVAFQSYATNLVPNDFNRKADIFTYEVGPGRVERASVSSSGLEGNAISENPALPNDGRYVTFNGTATTLIASDVNVGPFGSGVGDDVFIRDRVAGTTTFASLVTGGYQNYGNHVFPRITPDGRFVAFTSNASGWSAETPTGSQTSSSETPAPPIPHPR